MNQSDGSTRTGKRRSGDWRILLALVGLCLALRIAFFVGVGTNDDMGYIHHARNLSEGYNILSRGGSQLAFRLGMVVPLAAIHSVFGLREIAFSAFPLFCSLLTCGLLYLIGTRLWNERAGIMAALLWLACPLQIVFDTQLSPSNQHALCLAGSLMFYFLAADMSRRRSIASAVLCVCCGACLGIGWMVNELFVAVGIVGFVFALLSRPPMRLLVWVLLGFLLVMLADLVVSAVASGSWLGRFHSIVETEKAVGSNTELDYYPSRLFDLWGGPPSADFGHFGFLWYVLIPVPILALLRMDRNALWMSLGVWATLAFLQWGETPFAGEPIAKFIRYLTMLMPLACLSIGAVVARELKGRIRRLLLGGGFAVLCMQMICLGAAGAISARAETNDFRMITSFLKEYAGSHPVYYGDDTTGQWVELYSHGQLGGLGEECRSVPEPADGFVVVDGSVGPGTDPVYRGTMPTWYRHPPEGWQRVYTIRHRPCDCLHDEYDPTIYALGEAATRVEPDSVIRIGDTWFSSPIVLLLCGVVFGLAFGVLVVRMRIQWFELGS